MAVRIGHASVDENGKATGGKAGDQTEKEVKISNWYSNGWGFVARAKDPAVAEVIAVAAEAGCNNPNIGYDQNQRNTLLTQAKAVNFDLSKITTPCEADCSSFVSVCVRAALGKDFYSGNAPTTSTLKSVLSGTGAFDILTDSKYLTSDKHLMRGDILDKPGTHVVMVLDNGSAFSSVPVDDETDSKMSILRAGIDISHWQGDFDMERAISEGFNFVIIKGGGDNNGLCTDVKFIQNYENAKRLGLPVGAFWYSKALTVERALEEADYFIEHCLKGRQFDLPVYMDVESKTQLVVGKRLLTDIIHAFCQRLEEVGYWAGIYSSESYFSYYMIDSELQRYAHWVAAWNKSCNYSGSCFGMWQYGGETNLIRSNKVAGVVCDQDYMLIDYPKLIKAAGKNGYGAVEEPEEDAHVSVDLPILCMGDRGDAVWVLQTLLIGLGYSCGTAGADGDFGSGTENAVECFQEDNGLTVDGEVGGETWAMLLT